MRICARTHFEREFCSRVRTEANSHAESQHDVFFKNILIRYFVWHSVKWVCVRSTLTKLLSIRVGDGCVQVRPFDSVQWIELAESTQRRLATWYECESTEWDM